ncbi:hypothetical protein JCM10207_000175 [Rhodosporidiobolus poonsookiae]
MASAAPVTAQLPTSDRLSTLPVEILTEIFELAFTDTNPSKGPISRALLPFDRIHRFRRVEIDSPSRLNSLAVLLENGSMGAWIKEMNMEAADGQDGALPLQQRQLRTLFAALPNLTHLALDEGCSALFKLVISQTLARNSLRKLEYLSFVAPIEWKNPFEPTQFALLASYPSLRHVKIESVQSFWVMDRVKPLGKKFQPLPLIKSLTLALDGDGPLWRKLTKRLIKACPSLLHLHLTEEGWEPDYTALLPNLPQQLISLSLRTHVLRVEMAPCDALFPRLHNLEYLYLGAGTFSPAILEHLAFLPKLKTFGLGRLTILSTATLSTLLDTPSPLPSLRRIILDNVEGKIGWRAMFDGKGSLHPSALLPDYLGPGWIEPRFWDDSTGARGPISADELQELLDKASNLDARAPVKIEGTSVEALEIARAIEREREDCDFIVARQNNRFPLLRSKYGDEFFEARLAELGWADQ